MNKLVFPLLPVLVLAVACKKNSHVNTDEVRLQTMKTTDSSGNVITLTFPYDQQNRIAGYVYTGANGTSTNGASVVYLGNEITIYYTPVKSSTLNNSTVVWYKLNANNVPDRRIETDLLNVNDGTVQQIETTTDTTDYFYDASGLLTKATGSYFDSTWYKDNRSIPQRETNRTRYTRDYTNSNNMMTQIVVNKTESYIAWRSGTIYTGGTTTDGKYTFEYNHKYPNKTDFNNAVVLAEFGVIFNSEYLMNKAYAYIPDKVSYAETVKYSSGTPTSTSSSNSVNLTWGYNKYGFVSSMIDSYKHDFIYNY